MCVCVCAVNQDLRRSVSDGITHELRGLPGPDQLPGGLYRTRPRTPAYRKNGAARCPEDVDEPQIEIVIAVTAVTSFSTGG